MGTVLGVGVAIFISLAFAAAAIAVGCYISEDREQLKRRYEQKYKAQKFNVSGD